MTLRLDVNRWFCMTCQEFSKPKEPERLEPQKSDPARPKWLWLRLVILLGFLLLLALLQIYAT